jgi:hypothetical protein
VFEQVLIGLLLVCYVWFVVEVMLGCLGLCVEGLVGLVLEFSINIFMSGVLLVLVFPLIYLGLEECYVCEVDSLFMFGFQWGWSFSSLMLKWLWVYCWLDVINSGEGLG